MLPLTFADPSVYDEIGESDLISVTDLKSLAPDRPVQCTVTKPSGATVPFSCSHTFSREQIAWFHAGSALNVIRQKRRHEGQI
jgi:aconitate hydratase